MSVAMAATNKGRVHWDKDCVLDGNSDLYFLALFLFFCFFGFFLLLFKITGLVAVSPISLAASSLQRC